MTHRTDGRPALEALTQNLSATWSSHNSFKSKTERRCEGRGSSLRVESKEGKASRRKVLESMATHGIEEILEVLVSLSVVERWQGSQAHGT